MNSACHDPQRLEALKPHHPGIGPRPGIYGSIATGKEHPASDLDLLIDLPKGHSLLGLISLRQELEDLLSVGVEREPSPTTARSPAEGPSLPGDIPRLERIAGQGEQEPFTADPGPQFQR